MPLPCGDYIIADDNVINRKKERDIPVKKMDFLGTYNVTVDTKKDIQELDRRRLWKATRKIRE